MLAVNKSWRQIFEDMRDSVCSVASTKNNLKIFSYSNLNFKFLSFQEKEILVCACVGLLAEGKC